MSLEVSAPLILVTDDMNQSLYGTARSRTLFQVGLQLSRLFRSDLEMIHVDDPSDHNFREPIYRKFLAKLAEQGKVREYKFDDRSRIKIQYRLLEGDPLTKILQSITQTPRIKMVVMGTYGRLGFRRWLLGSVTKNVIQQSKALVVLVGHKCVQSKREKDPLRKGRFFVVRDELTPPSWLEEVEQFARMSDSEFEVCEVSKGSWWTRWKNTELLKNKIHQSYKSRQVTHAILPRHFPIRLRSLVADAKVPVIIK